VSIEAGQAESLSLLPPAGERPERLLADLVCEAFWERDVDSESLRWSGNLATLFGYPRAEVLEEFDWWRERVHPDDLGAVQQGLEDAIRDRAAAYSCEYRFRRKNGSWAWVASRCFILLDAHGKAQRLTGAMIDVTRIKETESRLRLFTEQLPARATVTDRDLRVLWEAGATHSDKPSTVGTTIPELFMDSPDRERVAEGCTKALAGESVRLEIDDGTAATELQLVPFRDPVGHIIGVVSIELDITDRKRAEQALWESREHLRTVLNTLPVGAVVLDRAGNVTLGNPTLQRIWGQVIDAGRERWQRSAGYWHESGVRVEPHEWASVRALRQGQTTLNELIDIETFDGKHKIVENSAAPIHDADGKVVGAVAVIQDVTERVNAEEALRKTERLLVDAEKLGATGSWEMDLVKGRILNSESNQRLFFGDDASKGVRIEDYADVVHPDDRDRVMRSREAMLAGTGPADIEYRVVWPDGSEHVIYARATVMRDDSGRPIRVYGTNADITERKRTHEELARRAAQLESLSRKLIQTQESERRDLSNELHDDLGQILFALKLNLQQRGDDNVESIGLVDGAIARMRDVVQALHPPLLDEFGLEASLRWHAEREATRAGLSFRLDLGPLAQRPPVTLEITCFRVAQEALSNVVRHAKARSVEIQLSEAAGVLHLAVSDDGQGFNAATARARATTGASHGLLSMQERVALVGGSLEIDSALGRGTSVRARLPLVANGS
jgi:two-component system sensor histidine kinase UhpB